MITVSDSAIKKIKEIMIKSQIEEGALRIKARTSGCDLHLILDLVETPVVTDRIFSFENIVIAIEKKSFLFLLNLSVDHKNDNFIFTNAYQKKCECC